MTEGNPSPSQIRRPDRAKRRFGAISRRRVRGYHAVQNGRLWRRLCGACRFDVSAGV